VAAEAAEDAAQEQAFNPTPQPVAPAGETPTDPVQPEQPEAPEAPAAEDTFDGGQFNPDTLPPELQAGWKQLQAAYTQKTQALAEERKQFEAYGSQEELNQALDLYNRIQDPRNWPDLYSGLTEAMQELGMTPAQAHTAATEAMQEAQQPAAPTSPAGDEFAALESDPELAPLVRMVREQQAELDRFKESEQLRAEAEQAERTRLQLVGEITRQEGAIRQANPKYNDEDMDMVYALSSHFGNLLQGQEFLESYFQSRFARVMGEKESLNTVATTPGTVSTAPSHVVRDPAELTSEDIAAELEESIRQQVAAGQIDMSDF
jgi:hypothetical protein